ncbi:MAG: hypothetical protein PWR03_1915 [Tenuifilum sp.]|jgi:hypothetical protein|uniref:DUF4956 domain-containing protein n=1 Tax=Tenuifilum sp. TaxID=2760880 RepID=UPI0024AC2E94|nr:DUF4956 domain-containing protein [Tenuifilum sp.]MDI3527732.1 hypothetical protein [Tenuifilum sp.]
MKTMWFLLKSNSIEIFGIDLINTDDFYTLILRFVLNIVIIWIAARHLYYPKTFRKDYVFTYLMLGTVVFFMCFLLANVKLQLGFALGLFAVFGIIRYRTNPIPIKEMTYLFLIIAISLINAISSKKVSYAELIFSNLGLILVAYVLEKGLFIKHLSQKVVVYEKIELITPERRAELIEDLKQRTGLDIKSVEIGKVDFVRDIAWIIIHYPSESFIDFTEIDSENNN